MIIEEITIRESRAGSVIIEEITNEKEEQEV